MFKIKSKGFTLIELMVVIAIIGILSSIVISSVTTLRMKARDQKRISDLSAIKQALELYRIDNGAYPPSPCGYNCNNYYQSYNTSWNTLANYLQPYIAKLPVDPINKVGNPWDGSFSYTYGNVFQNGNTYDLTTALETPDHPLSCKYKNYKFYFPNQIWCTQWGGTYSNQIYEASE